MKLQKLLTIGFLVVIWAAAVSAQNNLPNPNDDACWSSLSALRACHLRAYNAEMDYAQRCTSYPEYQCLPAEPEDPETVAAKHGRDKAAQATNTRKPGLKPLAPADTGTQTANAK